MTARYRINFSYHPDGLPLRRPTLVGSWDALGRFDEDWTESGRPLEKLPDGSWRAACLLEAEAEQIFYWGVRDSGEWMLFGQTALAFKPSNPGEAQQKFELGSRHRLGINPWGEDGFKVGLWAPHARSVELIVNPGPHASSQVLEKESDCWTLKKDEGWADMLGKPYAFLVTTSEGQKVQRSDPYARRRQGPQLGISDLFLKADGSPTHRYARDPRGAYVLRFEAIIRDKILKKPPLLRLFLEGKPLSAQDLSSRLDASVPLPTGETWWATTVLENGSLPLARRQDVDSYALCLGPADALTGLSYQILDEDGNAYHDPYSNLIDGYHNWPRLGVVSNPEKGHHRQRRHNPALEDLVIYEIHIGSILGKGGNLYSSTYGEVAAKLAQIKDLGFSAIALMPHGPSEGWRDWGYAGSSSMAQQEAYANPGESAEVSLIKFIAAAHELELVVLADVVYNHIGGNHNDLWHFDGYKNPWFEWNLDPELAVGAGSDLPQRPAATANALPQTASPSVKNTPWGPIPAFNKKPVFQFFLDHATDCVARLGFDGIRFDFTHLIHSQPTGGGKYGWLLLQEINRRLKHFFPGAITIAEEFPPHPILTTPVSEGGAGFNAMWNTEHQHRLVYSQYQKSLLQAVIKGEKPPLQPLLDQLLQPAGFTSPSCSVTVLSNHDEVGNATRIVSLVASHPRGLDIARAICWLSLLAPGYPIIFQGTEDLAANAFTWGIPSSWDVDSHLLGEEIADERKRHLLAIKDLLKLRKLESDLHAQVAISEHYLNTEAGIIAFKRGNIWTIGNFSEQAFLLPPSLKLERTELLSSEAPAYGYKGTPTYGQEIGSFAVKVFQDASHQS